MVSGFLISPNDQDRIFSGLASEIRIESNTCAGAWGLKRFMTSWFMPFSFADLSERPIHNSGEGRLKPSNEPGSAAAAQPDPAKQWSERRSERAGLCRCLYPSPGGQRPRCYS